MTSSARCLPLSVAKWGTRGTGDGQFDVPSGVAVDNNSGDVYVADADNNRIQKFDSQGNFITKWDGSSRTGGQLIHPFGVSADNRGDVYVSDVGNNRVQKFDSDGNYLTQWQGPNDGGFAFDAEGIAADNHGNVYVSDSANNRIQKFDSQGNLLTRWGQRPRTTATPRH